MNPTPTRYALVIFRAVLALAWTSTAAAAAVTVAKGAPIVLDPTVTVLTVILSTLAGATALFIRINNLLLKQEADREEGCEPRKFVRPWLFATAHMLGSWLMGVVAFLAGHAFGWDVWYGLMSVVLLSFGGATACERLAERYLSVLPLAPPPVPHKP